MTEIKKKISPSFFSLYLKTNLFILSFLIFSLFFRPGMLFYEGKLYVQYLVSFLQDFDFNLLNQVPKAMAWLATPTFHHPDQHPESQTALMLPLYALEFIAKKLSFTSVPASAFQFEYSLTTLAMNIFSLSLGFNFIQQICRQLSIQFHKFDFMFFTFGTALFYFSFLQTSVLEVTAFPLLSYLLLVYFNIRAGVLTNSPLICGTAIAFLLISKITFWPFSIALLMLIYFINIQARHWKNTLLLSLPLLVVFAGHTANRVIKYGFYLNDILPPLKPFYNYSFENFSRNLLLGFFPPGGLFFANPLYLFAVIGFFLLIKKLFTTKKISFAALFIFAFWFALVFLGHIFMGGYIVEDHLPGRIHLGFLPLLLLGFIYLHSLVSEKYRAVFRFILVICCVWHLYITFCYLVLVQGSSLVYANNMIPSWSLFQQLWPEYLLRVRDNISGIAAHSVQIIIFSVLLTLIYLFVATSKKRDNLIRIFCVICLISFALMSAVNTLFYKDNIVDMQKQGLLNNVVIGNGVEIFYLDYVLQYVSTAQVRCTKSICESLDLGLKEYYSKVAKQIIRSTPELDMAIKNNAYDFSYWLDIEKNKKSVNE